MRIKFLLFMPALFLTGTVSNAFIKPALTDTVPVIAQKDIKPVKIGPVEYYLPPPVDSVLLRRLAVLANNKLIDEGYQKKEKEDIIFRERQNLMLLQEILAQTETSGKPDESLIATLAQVLETYKKAGDLNSQSLIFNTYAVYYVNRSEPEKAVPYFQEALKLKEQIRDKAAIGKITSNLAAVLKVLGKYDESIALNEYTIRNSTAFKDRSRMAEAYINIAYMKSMQHKYAEAENTILKKALPLYQSAGNKVGRMDCFISLADMYRVQDRFSEAKWFYLQADLMADILNDEEAKVECLIKLADVKNAIGDHNLALDDYRKAELLASENNFSDKLAEIKGEIGETYWKMGNYTAAGTALKEYTKLKDNLLGVAQ